jgi:hypothetical protein
VASHTAAFEVCFGSALEVYPGVAFGECLGVAFAECLEVYLDAELEAKTVVVVADGAVVEFAAASVVVLIQQVKTKKLVFWRAQKGLQLVIVGYKEIRSCCCSVQKEISQLSIAVEF